MAVGRSVLVLVLVLVGCFGQCLVSVTSGRLDTYINQQSNGIYCTSLAFIHVHGEFACGQESCILHRYYGWMLSQRIV